MRRADRTRRECPSRRPGFRTRRPAGPAAPCSPSFACRLRRAAVRLALLLVFAPPLMLPLHAQAQTTIQLVSNIEESHVGNLFVGEVSGEQRAFAQKFTTGTSGEGYILRAVRLPATAILLTVEPRISIYDEANGRPGQIVHELSNPNSLGGSAAKRFGAESDAKLERETNYYVVVEAVATGGGTPTDNYNMGSTNSRTQTSAESTSWTIGDRRHDNINAGGWIEAPAASAVIRMRIDGYARPDTTLGELSITDANGAYAVAVDPVFAQDSVQYTAQAANGVETLTVVARANNAQATVEFLDTDNNPIADADDNKEGHQIAIDVGSNFFSVLVTAEQDAQKEYEVSVTRAAAGGALFASLVPAPSHDNVNLARRHVDLHLSTEVWKTIDHMRDWVLQTTNGTVESVERVTSISGAQGDLSAHWRIALRPVYAHRTMTLKVTPSPDVSLEAVRSSGVPVRTRRQAAHQCTDARASRRRVINSHGAQSEAAHRRREPSREQGPIQDRHQAAQQRQRRHSDTDRQTPEREVAHCRRGHGH